jgi:6-phosphogluconolactonase (cycloisomerase 2 family)
MTADGKQLLVSNRGYGPDSGSVTVYAVSSTTGLLSAGVSTKVGDNFPRGMGIVPGVNPPQLLVAGEWCTV